MNQQLKCIIQCKMTKLTIHEIAEDGEFIMAHVNFNWRFQNEISQPSLFHKYWHRKMEKLENWWIYHEQFLANKVTKPSDSLDMTPCNFLFFIKLQKLWETNNIKMWKEFNTIQWNSCWWFQKLSLRGASSTSKNNGMSV
jgi:hypothetical protein